MNNATWHDNPARHTLLIVAIGFFWALFTAFSIAMGDSAAWVQGAALLASLISISAINLSVFQVWATSELGILIALHVTAAMASYMNSDATLVATMRYVALLPAISLMLTIANMGSAAISAMRKGLTIGALVFVIYHCANINFAEIVQPRYRISLFVNTNSVCFISALTGVSLLDYAFRQRNFRRHGLFLLFALCVLLSFSTKSRTGTLALFSGIGGQLFMRFGTRMLTTVAAIIVAAIILVPEEYLTLAYSFFDSTYEFRDKWRSVEGGTGRFESWQFALDRFFWTSPLLGAGPGSHNELFQQHTSISGAHNGLLMNLCELGLLGTVPIILIWGITLKNIIFMNSRNLAFESSIFIAATVESAGETMFFSMGNPASLLFLLSLASISVKYSRARTLRVEETRKPRTYSINENNSLGLTRNS